MSDNEDVYTDDFIQDYGNISGVKYVLNCYSDLMLR